MNDRDGEGCTIWHRYAQFIGSRDWGKQEPPLFKLLLSYKNFDLEAVNNYNQKPSDMIGKPFHGGSVYKRLIEEIKKRQNISVDQNSKSEYFFYKHIDVKLIVVT